MLQRAAEEAQAVEKKASTKMVMEDKGKAKTIKGSHQLIFQI